MILLLQSPLFDPHISVGSGLVTLALGVVGVVIRWSVVKYLENSSHDRKALLSAIQRFDYIDTMVTAMNKVLTGKYPAEMGTAVQEVLQAKASAEAKAALYTKS